MAELFDYLHDICKLYKTATFITAIDYFEVIFHTYKALSEGMQYGSHGFCHKGMQYM
jgi:hypothetical protein